MVLLGAGSARGYDYVIIVQQNGAKAQDEGLFAASAVGSSVYLKFGWNCHRRLG
jgi:hypothetical protein